MFHFLSGTGRIPAKTSTKIARVCRRHGCTFVSVRLAEGWRYWATGPNRGFPFDRQLEVAVCDELRAAGVAIPGMAAA